MRSAFLLQAEQASELLAPIPSLGLAWVRLAEQVIELRKEIDQPVDKRSSLVARKKLLALAAIAARAARDCGVELETQAIAGDIPF